MKQNNVVAGVGGMHHQFESATRMNQTTQKVPGLEDEIRQLNYQPLRHSTNTKKNTSIINSGGNHECNPDQQFLN